MARGAPVMARGAPVLVSRVTGPSAIAAGRGVQGGLVRNGRVSGVDARGAQENEEFAGPEQDVQQSSALEIGEILGMQADVQSLARTLLDKRAHGHDIRGNRRESPAAGIHGFEPLVAVLQEMVQAKILLIQGNNRGAATRSCAAVSFPRHWTHRPHDPKFQSSSTRIVPPTVRREFFRRDRLLLPGTLPGDKGALV